MGISFSRDRRIPQPPDRFATKISRVVADLFGLGGMQPVHDVRAKDSSTGGPMATDPMAAFCNLWKVHADRKAIYEEIDRMDRMDEYISMGLDIIANFAVYGRDETMVDEDDDAERDTGAKLFLYTEDERAKTILRDLIHRTDLKNNLWQVARDTYKEADCFIELLTTKFDVYDKSNAKRKTNDDGTLTKQTKIVRLKHTIPYHVYPNENEKMDKVPGWIYRTEKDIMVGDKGKLLEEWQIVQFRFGNRIGNLTLPSLSSTRRNWLRLFQVEDGMAAARLLRAYDKYVHKIPIDAGMSQEKIRQSIEFYKQSIQKRRVVSADGFITQTDNPMEVNSDFFLPDTGEDKGSIDVLQMNNLNLGNLDDVYYHRERILARLGVPMGYFQIMSTQKTHLRAGGSMSDVDIAFAISTRTLQKALLEGIYRICDIELMLHGIPPKPGLYKLGLVPITTKDLLQDAKIELTYAQAAVYYLEAFGVIPIEFLVRRFLRGKDKQYSQLMEFFKSFETRIYAARIKTMESAAEPSTGIKDRLPGGDKGSGNNNKSRAKRSSEQKGAKQSEETWPLQDLVDLYESLHKDLYAQLQTELPNEVLPPLPTNLRSEIETRLLGIWQEAQETNFAPPALV